MKTFMNILKVLAVLVAIASVAFVVIRYGERIVAWCKETLGRYFPRRHMVRVPTEEAAAEDFEGEE